MFGCHAFLYSFIICFFVILKLAPVKATVFYVYFAAHK